MARAKEMKEFRAAKKALYEAPEPDPKPEITFETSAGTFKVRLYQSEAPEHCAQFVKNCKEGVYDGMRFHLVWQKPEGAGGFYEGSLAFLGDPESKEDTPEARAKWGQFRSEKQIDRELSSVSHFPFMVGADRDSGKLGSDQQLVYFTTTDCAERRDGNYVVFGRIVEGTEVVEQIVNAPLTDQAERNAGRGKPATTTKVEKVTVAE